jgi:hypothetical protein
LEGSTWRASLPHKLALEPTAHSELPLRVLDGKKILIYQVSASTLSIPILPFDGQVRKSGHMER